MQQSKQLSSSLWTRTASSQIEARQVLQLSDNDSGACYFLLLFFRFLSFHGKYLSIARTQVAPSSRESIQPSDEALTFWLTLLEWAQRGCVTCTSFLPRVYYLRSHSLQGSRYLFGGWERIQQHTTSVAEMLRANRLGRVTWIWGGSLGRWSP